MAAQIPRIFDRGAYRASRARAARAGAENFLLDAAAKVVVERLRAVQREFPLAVDLGSRASAFRVLEPAARHWVRLALVPEDLGGAGAVGDEEALPFAEGQFDLAVSLLSLHAVNDLPGALLQIRRVLKPDGLFLAALFAGETLHELRAAFLAGEAADTGGAAPRVAPFADIRELGALLQRAGFALPVADIDRTVVRYREPMRLFADLRAMGETSVLSERPRTTLARTTMAAALANYGAQAGEPDGRIRATFDIAFLTGWAPHDSQPKPLAPGSARMRLADAIGAQEQSGGDRTRPIRR